jgi:hypothetical protein
VALLCGLMLLVSSLAGPAKAEEAPFASAKVTTSLNVRAHTDQSCCKIGAPAEGDTVPVFCWRDGKPATYAGKSSRRWFLIQYAQTDTNHPIGFISVMAFNPQPKVRKCVWNPRWPEKWGPTATSVPPETNYVVPLCGQMLGPQPGTPEWDEYCSNGSGGGTDSGGGGNGPDAGPDTAAIPAGALAETAGGVTHTWTNPTNAGGTQGPSVASGQTIGVACKVTGFRVADGNTWWYRIASSPWNNQYYASADAFYNNGATSGPLRGTPFVDPAVPDCGGPPVTSSPPPPPPPPTWTETVGGNANTWTNYSNAGGTQGPTIPAYSSVQIACKVTGFRVADGNTWWYRIASSPWNGQFYVSADAFYNNGATSGSLHGTPFVDNNVANC